MRQSDPMTDGRFCRRRPGARTAGPAGGRGARPLHGFTLVEVLVVIAIIALLIGILVPAVGMARKAAEVSATSQFMQAMVMGINTYDQDHDLYPPSNHDDVPAGYANHWNGGEILVECLMGHLPESDDGKDGLGFRTGGRPYGPYIDVQEEEDIGEGEQSGDGDKVFLDYWGNPICYYRANRGGSTIWGDRFRPADNGDLDGGNPLLHDTTDDSGDQVEIGNTDAAALNAARFVLYSRGPDLNNGNGDQRADDIIITGP